MEIMQLKKTVSLLEQTTIETAAATDAGLIRFINEDSIAIVAPDEPAKRGKGTVLVLADGLGGYNAGEVASTLVTSNLPKLYFDGSGNDYVSDLVGAVGVCNSMIHEASLKSAGLQGMG